MRLTTGSRETGLGGYKLLNQAQIAEIIEKGNTEKKKNDHVNCFLQEYSLGKFCPGMKMYKGLENIFPRKEIILQYQRDGLDDLLL